MCTFLSSCRPDPQYVHARPTNKLGSIRVPGTSASRRASRESARDPGVDDQDADAVGEGERDEAGVDGVGLDRRRHDLEEPAGRDDAVDRLREEEVASELGRAPGRDRVRADPPRVRQRVAVAEQAVGEEHGRRARDAAAPRLPAIRARQGAGRPAPWPRTPSSARRRAPGRVVRTTSANGPPPGTTRMGPGAAARTGTRQRAQSRREPPNLTTRGRTVAYYKPGRDKKSIDAGRSPVRAPALPRPRCLRVRARRGLPGHLALGRGRRVLRALGRRPPRRGRRDRPRGDGRVSRRGPSVTVGSWSPGTGRRTRSSTARSPTSSSRTPPPPRGCSPRRTSGSATTATNWSCS